MARNLEAAAIPDDWKYGLLDNFAVRCSGHTPSKSHPEYWDGGIKWISLADSYRLDNGYIYSTDKEISLAGINNSSAEVHPAETVVISRDAGIGKSGVMAEPMAVSQHFIAWKCDNKKKLNSWFLYNWLQLYKAEFERQAVGSTIKTIGLPYFKKLKIAVPPYSEQKKIAQILSSWDKAISITEQLLINSQQQRKSLNQQLLTGKKRFPGFDDKWNFKKISEIATRIQRKTDGSNHPILTISSLSGFVRQDERYSRYMAGESVKNYILLNKGEFAYNKGNSKSYEFGCIFDLDNFETGLVPHVYVCFKLSDGLSHRYFKYIFEADYLKEQLGSLVNTGVRNNGLLNIKPSEFMMTKIPVPKFEEQEKIADILHASSQTIKSLKSKLMLLKQEKKALMQQLLTGKLRVKVEAA
ncbi:restriction endonuclease subunit S [Erwinia rhapontici]|uniref:restriction endonuclease subunit S n=1 Tax=Erwinia rhapontici TaxID=55212 RepID=UPI00216AA9F3|nr:restriction endonuclease subunit S [Erwinia rhapontici]MCS3608475.1 type I restriction enzyme S subunit [Erwinia rhapontici]